jgi:mannitol/fructose-specific phosphotransferase system IIA component (Ntr-type)
MSLADSVQCALLLDDSRARSRDQAIKEMLALMADEGLVPASLVSELRETLIFRDELGPTGIGEGVAIPHAWHPGLDRIVAALAVSECGLDYPSLDGEPVHIILLILTPPSSAFEPAKRGLFDDWLRRLREPAFRASLRLAATSDELRRAIRAADHPPL